MGRVVSSNKPIERELVITSIVVVTALKAIDMLLREAALDFFRNKDRDIHGAPVDAHHPTCLKTRIYPHLRRALLDERDIGKTFVRIYPRLIGNYYDWSYVPYIDNTVECSKVTIKYFKDNEIHVIKRGNADSTFDASWNDGYWVATEVFNKFLTQQQLVSVEYDPSFSSPDPYAVLGLNPHCKDLTTLTKRYKELTLKHHPDKKGDPAIFTKIAIAYKQIKDRLTGESSSKTQERLRIKSDERLRITLTP